MRTIVSTIQICLLACTTAIFAQEPAPKSAAPPAVSLITHGKGVYTGAQRILLATAEKMPEENYAFKPTEAVRSFGQILGHVADSQYFFCSAILGEKNPGLKIEKNKTSKADLIASLKESFAYCDRAWEGTTDATSIEMVKVMGSESPRLGALTVNTVHSIEHYGNLITYMRLKNLVPPTSDPEFMKSLMK